MKFYNSSFIQNVCNINGGALAIEISDKIQFNNVYFIKNIALKNIGGGIITLKSNEIEVNNCKFYKNVAFKGGALSFKSSHTKYNSIKNSLFIKNICESKGGGVEAEVL